MSAVGGCPQFFGGYCYMLEYPISRAGFDAITKAVLIYGGKGYAREHQFERLFRESMLLRIAPVTEQLILSFIAELILNLPKSY